MGMDDGLSDLADLSDLTDLSELRIGLMHKSRLCQPPRYRVRMASILVSLSTQHTPAR